MIGLVVQPFCAFAASAIYNYCNPQTDVGMHMQTYTANMGGPTPMQLGRHDHRLRYCHQQQRRKDFSTKARYRKT